MADDRTLEEEREFLFRSLADLEREFSAGDIDSDEYEELRDGYTARAAAVLRAIAEGEPPVEVTVRSPRVRRFLTVLCVVAVAAGLSWWVAASSGQRLDGQQMTGADPRGEVATLLAQARATNFADPAGAADMYGLVLAVEPDNVEALAYRGWTLALAARQNPDESAGSAQFAEAIDLLITAIQTDPSYADPICFLGIIQYRFVGDADAARPLVSACLASNPPAVVYGLVENLANELGVGPGSG